MYVFDCWSLRGTFRNKPVIWSEAAGDFLVLDRTKSLDYTWRIIASEQSIPGCWPIKPLVNYRVETSFSIDLRWGISPCLNSRLQ